MWVSEWGDNCLIVNFSVYVNARNFVPYVLITLQKQIQWHSH